MWRTESVYPRGIGNRPGVMRADCAVGLFRRRDLRMKVIFCKHVFVCRRIAAPAGSAAQKQCGSNGDA